MKIAILSRQRKNYSVVRLVEAARKRGHTIRVMDTLEFGIHVAEEAPDLTYKGKHCPHFDAVIPRIGASITFFGTAVVRQFEQMGVFCVNASNAINVSRDKLRSLQVLSRHDIGIPDSAFVRGKNDILNAIERVGGAPVIIKLLEGTQGVGVVLADNQKIAEAIIEMLQSVKQNILIQKFVAESKGKDIRALVIGDRVVAAMRRQAVGQEFRSNVHRGGQTQAVTLDPEYERTAVKAAQIMGLRMAGVDMLESDDGPSVMEVNSSPGLEGIEKASGVDIADAIIETIEEHAQFEELDLRQRLTLTKGYAVVEIPVSPTSELVNKTLEETHLRQQEVLVLSINRRGILIPVPNGATEVLPGDTLLCYGKRQTLKSFIVPRPRRRRKPKRKPKPKAPSKAATDPDTPPP